MNGLAIITGTSSGIGEAAARRFLVEGWSVIGIARRLTAIPGVTALQANLEDPAFAQTLQPALLKAVQACAPGGAAVADRPQLISLIHNAARFTPDNALDTNPIELARTLQVNVVACAALNAMLAPMMGEGSSILYVGSTLSEKAVPGLSSYVVSKHAVAGLMRATCQDLRGRRVHTACICPGFVDTPLLRTRQGEADMRSIAAMTTYDRVLRPEEIADLLFYAAVSPALNGAVIHANYGQTER